MEEDSGQLDKSDQMNHIQPPSQQSCSPSQSLHCNHCALLFKSRHFLLEHMEKVHGIKGDPSRRERSCTPMESSTAPHSTLYNSSARVFSCRHCVFTSSNWTLITKHERTYHKAQVKGYSKGGTLKNKKLHLRGKLLHTKVSLSGKNNQNVSAIQCKQGVKERVISKSTSKTINIPSSSLLLKNLQAQAGSTGNISKFRVVSGTSAHGSSLNSSQLKLTNLPMPSGGHSVTLRSDAPFIRYEQGQATEERSHAEVEQKDPHCCSLCNFSATWLEDLLTHQRSNHSYLFYSVGSNLLEKQAAEQRDLKSETCTDISLKDPLANTSKKRPNDDNSPAKKKIKTRPESTVIQSRLLGCPAFTFEVSEDEEEGNASRPERDTSRTKIYERGQLKNRKSKSNRKKLYSCKQCDYSHKSYRGVSTHYQRMHPYIRFDIQYIIDPDNWTATFRCLECPIEFATPDDLKKHYRDHHPESPNVFVMRSDQLDLVYKCFACPFTISNGKYLKYHYKHKHPELEMGNHLMCCSYTAKPSKADSFKSQHLGETSSPKITDIMSPERSLTLCQETTPPKPCSVSLGVNEELYHCKHCAFSNISVVVMFVHYQRSHPKAGLTIDSIKQSSLATSVKPRDETHVSPEKMNLEPFKFPEVKPNNSSLASLSVSKKELANLFFCQHCDYGNLTVRGVLSHQRSRHSDLKATVEQILHYTAEVHSQRKISPGIAVGSPRTTIQNSVAQEEVLTPFKLSEVESSNASPPISSVLQVDAKSLYFCQFCDYSNPTVRGIMNHQKLRHITCKSTAERIIKHTAVIRKKHKMRKVVNQHKSHPRHLKVTAKKVVTRAAEFHGRNEKHENNSSTLKTTLEKVVDELFFCQYCNYGNPRVLGVLNHQKLRHRYLQTSTNDIIQHTSELRSQKTFLSAGFDFSNSSVFMSDNDNEGCNLFFCQVCNYGNPSVKGILNHQKKRHCELKTDTDDIFRHTAEVHEHANKTKIHPNSSHMLPLPPVTEEAVLFCQLCNYSNPTMRVVVDHQRKRHPDLKATAKQILRYTAMILVRNCQSSKSSSSTSDFGHEELDEFFCQYCDYSNCTVRGILNHHNKSHSDLETNTAQVLRHTVVVRGQRTSSKAENPPLTVSRLQDDEVDDIFFCQICNYSNLTAKGVLNHQRKKHLEIKTTVKQIVEYTSTVCQSQPVQEDSLKSQQEEGMLFYCQYCDYHNPTVRGVLSHQKLKHSDLKATADQVVMYTADVCKPNKDTKIHQHNTNSMKASQSCMQKAVPVRSIKSHRSLKCRNCSYTTPHIYLLKRHLRINHQELAPITTIINWAYQDGYLQAGYHCEWCVCSHAEAKGLLRHYRQRHPDKSTGLESIILRLHAGPKSSQPKETNLKPENDLNLEHITPHTGDGLETFPSFESRGGDTKLFPCRACPFKATSMGGISSHYRVVHPWSVKEDGSVLDVISSRQTQETEVQESLHTKEASMSNETHRCPVCPLEFPTLHSMSTHCGKKHPEHDMKVHKEPDVHETPKPRLRFRCPVCSGLFNTLHGMLTHCGKKHPDHDTSTYEKVPEQEPSSDEGTLVFKCSVCPYVNSRSHGVLTHSQMRHPAVKVSTETLDQEIVHFTKPEECVVVRSGKRMGLAGFRCNMCPVIHAKFKTLKTHYELDHKRSASNMFKPAIKQSVAIKKQLISKYRGSQTSIVQAAILKKGQSIFIKCHLCKYFCTTKKGLARHLRINHSTLAPNEDKSLSYKCALCSYTTLICKYLAAHYRRQHGNAAFNSHFVPAFRPLRVPPTSPSHKDSLNQELKSPGEKIKCSCCFFQCLSEKGMVSHYAICHPGVSPIKPDSSKVSPNKVMHSPPKPRSRPRRQKPVCKIFDPQCEEGNSWSPVKCKKCENLFFNSSLLLSIHYTNFHKEDFKQDFAILSKTSEDGIEFYKCEHCNIKIHGSADLGSHLDFHNEESLKFANEQMTKQHLSDSAPKTKSVVYEGQELPEVLPPEESDDHWILTKVESVATGTGPLLFPSNSRTEPEGDLVGEECKHCGRTFKSLKGLRSHERSHAATAALKRLETVPHQQKQMFDRHIQHRPGTIKPFRCMLCRYRTTILSLLKNHLLKVHSAKYKNHPSLVPFAPDKEHTLRINEEGANLPPIQDFNQFSDSEESDLTEKRVYSEPPDVQRQLKHYRHLAQANAPSLPEPKSTGITQDGVFTCEFCIYTSAYIKSMRRHYISRHNGKRLVRCKDCSFLTGLRKKLDMHMETAHASGVMGAVRDLHCPLCLYHTKNPKRMIDHVVLHREEPVAPIEVRRPKLSRYLRGVVFRCHKCTFTSSSGESLHLHMDKHSDIKPYKCRLCYFDCTQLSELEAHLCDMHQVMRNHDLVGQVHLGELETTLNTVKWEERRDEEPGSDGRRDKTSRLKDAKQRWLEDEQDNIELRGSEEESLEETCKVHKEKRGVKEGHSIKEPGTKKGEKTFNENNGHGHKDKKNMGERSPDSEKKDEADRKDDGEEVENVAPICGFRESPCFGEERYEQCHENSEDKDEEQFLDCQEQYQELGERDMGEQNERYHEMPVLENEEWKVGIYSHGEEQGEESLKTDRPKPECNKKGKLERKIDENILNAYRLNDASTTLGIDASSTLRIIPTTNENGLSCKLCGRTLMNSTDLERHVLRHGI